MDMHSLLLSGIAARLALALGASAFVWLGYVWAIA